MSDARRPEAEERAAAAGPADGTASVESPSAARARGRSKWRRGWRRTLVLLLVALLGTYAVWCSLLYRVQDQLMFPRDFAPQPFVNPHFPSQPIELRHEFEPGRFAIAWYFPVPGASAERPAPAVIYFHGNAEIIDQQDDFVRRYHALGLSVLLPEYRGYGRSDGEPSQAAIAEDVRGFYDQLVRRPEVDRARLVYHGRSLGGGPAADLALHAPPAAMILESTFTSAAAMALRYGAPPVLVKNPFYVDRVLRELDAPVLIFHGAGDNVIPVSHGRRLSRCAKRCVYVEYDFMHDDMWLRGHGEAYWAQIVELLRAAGVLGDEVQASAGEELRRE